MAQGRDLLGEGPVWAAGEGRLYWFDIQGRRLNWLSHADGTLGAFDLPVRASVAAPRVDGGLILVTEAGLAHLDTGAGAGAFEMRQPMTFEPGFRTNDGKIDLAGRLWWSTMDDDGGKRPGALYRTDLDGRTQKVLDGLHIANTVSCSPDGATLYLADSAKGTLWAFPVTADGALGERRVFATPEVGAPDGSAVDAEGHVWNCQWGAWRIVRYAPDGRVDRIVPVPVEQVSSCAFGGPDLATLYVTSAREHLSDKALAVQPLAGGLFAFEPGVRGLALPAYAGEVSA